MVLCDLYIVQFPTKLDIIFFFLELIVLLEMIILNGVCCCNQTPLICHVPVWWEGVMGVSVEPVSVEPRL